MPKTLYIIGNGFDRHHELDSSYDSFALFLDTRHSEIYELLVKYFPLPDVGFINNYYTSDKYNLPYNLWANFERDLATLDIETIIEDHSYLAENSGSDDFRAGDWYSCESEIHKIVETLTTKLVEAFREFILAINFPDEVKIRNKILALEKNSIYLSFNYTNTLERYYSISPNNIHYIHGKASNPDEEIYLGHGVNPEEFEEEEEDVPEGLDDDQLEKGKYHHSYNEVKKAAINYFKRSHKPTEEIIKQSTFFDNIKDVNRVIILGHSLSEVDLPYFRKIVQSLSFYMIPYKISYYSDEESQSHLNTMLSLGLNERQIDIIKINAI